MAPFPCLPLWTDAWKADTDHLSLTEEGAYFRLVYTMWRTPGCRVPNDNGWLAKHLRLSAQEVADVLRPVIAEFCQTDGNWITQKKLLKVFRLSFERAGRLSALHKRRKNKGPATNGSRSSADDHREQSGNLLNSNYKPYFLSNGESQCNIPSTTSTTKDPTTDHLPEPATQDLPQAKTTTPSPPPTVDQPAGSKSTTADNPDPPPPNQPPTPHPPPTNSKPPSNTSQRPPETLAEINNRMGWTPAGTRKPFIT